MEISALAFKGLTPTSAVLRSATPVENKVAREEISEYITCTGRLAAAAERVLRIENWGMRYERCSVSMCCKDREKFIAGRTSSEIHERGSNIADMKFLIILLRSAGCASECNEYRLKERERHNQSVMYLLPGSRS